MDFFMHRRHTKNDGYFLAGVLITCTPFNILTLLMKKIAILSFLFLIFQNIQAQSQKELKAAQWADSVFQSLTDDQRIAQLMVMRESSFTSKGPVYYDSLIRSLVSQYNIGGICMFQGTPEKQARFVNEFQAMAQTPLLVCIDGEWGLGMRFDSVKSLKHPMMLGAMQDSLVVYEYGRLVGRQMKRMGVQVNYAPVVDVNNNPANPVINDRSFGENKYKVAAYGLAYMHGMQDEGIMACAKHFPGHGDVSVDSHHDLPVINKTMAELDSMELYPFRRLIEGGVASVMIGHLSIPVVDTASNTATSISKAAVTGLLRNKLGFEGLTFTDALGMKGVASYFPGGRISAASLIAGNDMLCLPEDVPESIAAIRDAISAGELSWDDIYEKCKKVLRYKYMYGLADLQPIEINNLTEDLNDGIDEMNRLIARNAITLVKKTDSEFFPLKEHRRDVAFIGIGLDSANTFAGRMKADYDADEFFFNYKEDNRRILSTVELIKKRYKNVVISIHNYKRFPANKFGISDEALDLLKQVAQNNRTIVFAFGNPYAIQYFCDAKNLVAAYEDDSVTHQVAADMLYGRLPYKGSLPVTVCPSLPAGTGVFTEVQLMQRINPAQAGMSAAKLQSIDSIVHEGIKNKAFPGAVVLAAKDGKIFYEKAFGSYEYDGHRPMTRDAIFDLASVTKIMATTISIMKLYDEGKIELGKTLGTYLPWVRKSDKKDLTIENILLHQAGLVAYIPFFRNMIDKDSGTPLSTYFRQEKSDNFPTRVAQNLYLRSDYQDSIYQIILDSKLGKQNNYVYSDNDFIFLGKIVEEVSGDPLDVFADKHFYSPMGLTAIGFLPRNRFEADLIVPTEHEKHFRMQQLNGDVHDPGAALFGGVAGHAGLFGKAADIAALAQMLDNGGSFGGRQYLKESTVRLFTAYNSPVSRRGLGFDKPQKDNYTTTDPRPYPSRFASPLTYGHTGYTGTCVWVDPKYNLVYVFLSNRVHPDGGDNTKLITMNIRGAIEDALYRAMIPVPGEVERLDKSKK